VSEKKMREAFEAWISKPPFEHDCKRHPMDERKTCWPGAYKRYETDLAWEAWQAALAEQPAPMSELIKKAGDLRDYLFIAEHHEESETVAALIAEVERLKACLRMANEQAERFERNWYLRGDALEAAEARLREIAGAEPVAGVVLRDGQPTLVSKRHLIVDGDVALIRRPEMPS